MLALSFSGMHACFYMHHRISRMFLCIQLSEKAEEKVKASRNVVDGVVKDGTGRSIVSQTCLARRRSHHQCGARSGSPQLMYNCVEFIFSTVACMQLSMVSILDLELWKRKPFHPISLSKPA